jgi:UDP-glucuronate 4-epimerase
MALFLFTKAILAGEPIKVFNNGKHKRSFTYVDDIVEGVIRVLDQPATINKQWDGKHPDPSTSGSGPYRIYNIGNEETVELMRYIEVLEQNLGKKAIMQMLPLQPGDVPDTEASVDALAKHVGYTPKVSVEEGVANFVKWYQEHYVVN